MRTAVAPAILTLALTTRMWDASDAAGPTVSGSGSETRPCSQACLAQVLSEFKSSVLEKKPVKLAEDAQVRENMEITTVEQSAWKDVKAIRSTAVFADAVTGNVVARDGVELLDGKPAYISTRLRVDGGRITEVELSSDAVRANPAYVWSLPAVLTELVPRDERASREALEALTHRYFRSLTDHKGVAADFDDTRCNRFHSGHQVTNVSRNSIESRARAPVSAALTDPSPGALRSSSAFR